MALKIYTDNNLKILNSVVQPITEYNTDELVLMTVNEVVSPKFSWITPTNLRFAERELYRAPQHDDLGYRWVASTETVFNEANLVGKGIVLIESDALPLAGEFVGYVIDRDQTYYETESFPVKFAYSAVIYPVMSAGLIVQQDSGKCLFSFRIDTKFSSIVKVSVNKSIFPEQTQLAPSNIDELQNTINNLEARIYALENK